MKSTSKLQVLAMVALGILFGVTQFPAIAAMLPADGGTGLGIMTAGMLINRENVSNIFIGLKTTFNNAFAAAPSVWQKIAMRVPSTTGQNDYSWLSNFPRMRKWIGEKAVKALSAFKYTVVNDDFEATVEVDRNHIEDDNLGIYGPQAQGAGHSAKQFPDELVFEAVNAGFATQCYDGQYFFDTDHPVTKKDGTVISVSNKGTKKLKVGTLAEAQNSYGVARTAMKSFTDDEGRPLNITPNVLLVHPAKEDDAKILMSIEKFQDGTPNPYRNTAEVVADGRLESPDAWFLLDTTKPVMPFIYQDRKSPVFVSQTDMASDDVFNRRMFKFGAEARGAAGYGFWQLAYGSTGTVD